MLMNWQTDAKTQSWAAAFNTALAGRQTDMMAAKLRFKPPADFEDPDAQDLTGVTGHPLLILKSAQRFKYVYYIAGASLVMALVVMFYTLPLALSGQVDSERMVLPVVVMVMLVIFGLAYGLPAFLYQSRREIVFFADHLAFIRRGFHGRRKILRAYLYESLQNVAVGYHICDESRYDADAGDHSPDYSKHWAYALTFQNPGAKAKRRIISAHNYADAQTKMTFWQNNLVWTSDAQRGAI